MNSFNRFISVTTFNKSGVKTPALLSATAIVSVEYATRPDGAEGTRLTMLNGCIFLVYETAAELFRDNDQEISFH